MRKLLGYRLKEEKYKEAANKIVNSTLVGFVGNIDFTENTEWDKQFRQAGVMHWFEEVYEEDKFTGWLKDDGFMNEHWMGYFEKGVLKYGINAKGDWFIQKTYCNRYYLASERPATPEEIQQALIKEAKKRGFKEGVIVDNSSLELVSWKQDANPIRDNIFYLDGNTLALGQKWIFQNGKWAEILPAETLNVKTAIIDGVEYELKLKD